MNRRVVVAGAGCLVTLVAGGLAVIVLFLVVIAGATGAKMAQAGGPCGAPGFTGVPVMGGSVHTPIAGTFTVTSGFGMRFHPIQHRAKLHAGVDLAGIPAYGPVLAVKAGRVTRLAPNAGTAGNLLEIDHGAGLTSVYMHLRSFTTREGDDVVAGQQIAVEGNTGGSTGPHLHFEIHQSGRKIDPALWLSQQGLTLPAIGQTGQATSVPGRDSGPSPHPSRAVPLPAITDITAAGPLTGAGGSDLPARIGPYGPDQVRHAATIVAVGRGMSLDDHTIAIGLMTAIGESTLINVDHGDRAGPDSRGLFQQRANGAWGTYAERMTPAIAARNFFRALITVPSYRSLPPTIAAHRTQRNDDPQHYARYWPDAVTLLEALSGVQAGSLGLLAADGAATACDPTALAGTGVDVAALPAGPATQCPPSGLPAEIGLRPGAAAGLRCIAAAFHGPQYLGVGERTQNPDSDHPKGLAVDIMIANYRTPAGRASGWRIATWLTQHADQLGLTYVIWDMQTWSARRPDAGWQPYTKYGPNPGDNLGHRNHVHVSFRPS